MPDNTKQPRRSSMGMMQMEYTFGDSVRIAATERGNHLRPCEIVAITTVETIHQADAFNVPLGTVLYTVEFGDGSDALVPEDTLEPFAPAQSSFGGVKYANARFNGSIPVLGA
jgi:hypothetical protein